MASQKQVKIAKDQYAKLLAALGAHTLAIDYLSASSKKNFALIAITNGDVSDIPKTLEIVDNGTKARVPVIAEFSEKFKPQ
jgi:hypothetical protein